LQASAECSDEVKSAFCDEMKPNEAAAAAAGAASQAESEVECGDGAKDDTGGTSKQEPPATVSADSEHA